MRITKAMDSSPLRDLSNSIKLGKTIKIDMEQILTERANRRMANETILKVTTLKVNDRIRLITSNQLTRTMLMNSVSLKISQ